LTVERGIFKLEFQRTTRYCNVYFPYTSSLACAVQQVLKHTGV